MDFKDKRLMMSKEEVINRTKEWLDESQEDLITKYLFLEQQCKKQKEVIEKIMYKIENYTTLNEPRIRKELLDILKEEKK